MNRQLSQQEIDAVFETMQDHRKDTPAAKFDFRRPARIPRFGGPSGERRGRKNHPRNPSTF